MKRIILILTVMTGSIVLISTADAACYDPTYPSAYCDTQGFNSCPSDLKTDNCKDDTLLP